MVSATLLNRKRAATSLLQNKTSVQKRTPPWDGVIESPIRRSYILFYFRFLTALREELLLLDDDREPLL